MRVRVADRTFERSLPDSLFEGVKEKLKSVCRFEPSRATWVLDPRKAICRDPSFLSELFGVPEELIREEVQRYRSEVDERLRRMFERGKFAFLPCGEVKEPFGVEEGLAVVDLREIRNLVSKLGPLRAYEKLINSINGYYLDELLEKVREILSVKKEVVMREGKRGIILEIPYADEGLLRDLESIATVKYYVKTLREVRVQEIRVLRRVDGCFEAPYFTNHWISRIAGRNGFSVRDEVSWPDEEVHPLKNFSLYDFQEEAVRRWEDNGKFGTIVMPTGAGKTYVGLEAIFRTSRSTLVCVVNEEMVGQWVELVRERLSLNPGVFSGRKKEVRPITVGIYNSVAKHIDSLYDRFSLIIFDEVHHVPASTFKEVAFRSKAKYRLGLSATPERADGNDHLIFLTSGDIVYKISFSELLSRGFLAPVRHHLILVNLSEEERRRMERELVFARTEEDRRLIEKRHALRAREKLREVLRITEEVRDRKVLIFTEYVDQAEEIYGELRRRGYRAELMIGKTSNRAEIFDRFRRGEVNVIVTTRVLDEGIDVPDADVAIIVSGSGSRRQMAQRVGRVVRGAPGKVADVYEIVTRGTVEERLSRARRRGIPFLRREGFYRS
ncbi:MAG: DEAD/DEAH box helicase [Candidatus Korarchaeum sp.]